MSRSKKGSKPLGYDFWSKRPYSGCGYGSIIKDMTHRVERMLNKETIVNELKVLEIGEYEDLNVSDDPLYKSLFPDATTIMIEYDPIFQEQVIVVDNERVVDTLRGVNEILSFQYHCGESGDFYALCDKYDEYIERGNDRWSFLP